jgi:hypothetical protein
LPTWLALLIVIVAVLFIVSLIMKRNSNNRPLQ